MQDLSVDEMYLSGFYVDICMRTTEQVKPKEPDVPEIVTIWLEIEKEVQRRVKKRLEEEKTTFAIVK